VLINIHHFQIILYTLIGFLYNNKDIHLKVVIRFVLCLIGGDYLVEITGKFLNVYGQGSLRYIDKPWNQSKSNDVSTIKFNYVSFNSLVPVFSKIKNRFPNAENYFFRDTNIYCLGQLNALADLQGLVSLYIHEDGNPITRKEWHSYAIFRLSHWGLKFVNDNEVFLKNVR